MNLQPTVMKFGGTSVEDEKAFRRVARIIHERRAEQPVVVVSAMSRVTDALLESARRAAGGDAGGAASGLAEHFQRHTRVADDALTPDEAARFHSVLESARAEIDSLLREAEARRALSAELQDAIISYGERLSSFLLAAVLRSGALPARHVDARRCIITDEEFGCARPLFEETYARTRAEIEKALAAREVPVLGGFIAATFDGRTTTLGRGGSDYSAALIGAGLKAREIQIWTDVPGVLTADPRVVGAAAATISSLSYEEAAELSYFGAKVLHPKTILPAYLHHIPVRICDSRAPYGASTVIYSEAAQTGATIVKSIAHKKGVTIVHVTSARMLDAFGFLRAIFEVFERHRTAVDMVTTSEVSVSLSLDDTSALEEILADLNKIGRAIAEHGRAIVCIVGEGVRNTPGIAAKVFAAIDDINVLLISQGASRINLTFVVEEASVETAVRQLHDAFFKFGNTRELYLARAELRR